jgi:histidinol-phosphate phosphatase family protein
MYNKAIFFDKDGTLINDVPYNVNPERITLSENCLKGIRSLQKAGYLLVVITNQAGLGLGYFNEAELLSAKNHLFKIFEDEGITFAGFYYCPHLPNDDCNCRKPKQGMIIDAAKEMQIDLSVSWMVGDILNDVEAGKRAGCRTILINNGNETEWLLSYERTPERECQTINEAAEYILSTDAYGRLEEMQEHSVHPF